MKKIVVFCGFLLAFLSNNFEVRAEGINIDINNYEHEITYQDDEITVITFNGDDAQEISEKISNSPTAVIFSDENLLINQENDLLITPFKTITGPGGVVTLDTSDDRRSIYWSVKPNTNWPFAFEGSMELKYNSGFRRTAPLFQTSLTGTPASGIVTMNAHKGGIAYLSGTAYALNNTAYKVMPYSSIPYAASR